MLSKDVFSTVGGNGKDGWVDAVNPTGAECEKAACATKFQTQSGTLIPYDESFDMDAGDSGYTCLKFKDEKPKLEDEDCGDTDRRPICSCDSESSLVRFRRRNPLELGTAGDGEGKWVTKSPCQLIFLYVGSLPSPKNYQSHSKPLQLYILEYFFPSWLLRLPVLPPVRRRRQRCLPHPQLHPLPRHRAQDALLPGQGILQRTWDEAGRVLRRERLRRHHAQHSHW